MATNLVAITKPNLHRPFSAVEQVRRQQLEGYFTKCSEDKLIEEVLLPLFRQMSFQLITATDYKNKAPECGKDVWMKFALPTQHILHYGIEAKRGKIDASGSSTANIAESHN